MDNVDFDEQQFQPRNQINLPNQSGIIGWLIQKGIVKDIQIANYVLLGATVLFIILTIIIFFLFIKQPSLPENIDNTVIDPALII